MILHDDGEYETEEESEEEMPPLEDASDFEDEEAEMGRLVAVVKRALSVQLKKEAKVQRENIFHTRCCIGDKVCSMIIDGGSCTNFVSTFLVES